MALEATFRDLAERLLELQRKVIDLQSLVDSKPDHDGAAVADDFSDKTLELQGTIHEARQWLKSAMHFIVGTADINQARRALGQCQEKFHEIEQMFRDHMVSYEKLRELARVRGRDPDWSDWGRRVRSGIDHCRDPMAQSSKALASCWQELAERSGLFNISVTATGMIQNIAGAPKPEVSEEEFYAGGS